MVTGPTMKYNTLSTSSLSSEGRKSTLTLYTDPDFLTDKVSSSESEISSVRSELEIVQRALSLQTRRCRQLVAEYTRRLQEKEAQYQSEKLLREDQLAKVLRALLIFEARLKQEQKYISHQLAEKDKIITKQREHIHNLSNNVSSTYCKHCTYYGQKLESLGSSSEYVVTDYQDSNISNVESLDSSSETYATISNDSKDGSSPKSLEDKDPTGIKEQKFQKNKSKDGPRRGKRVGHRKSIGDYYEVLKMRNEQISPSSDNTSNDYEHIDTQGPVESSVHSQISEVSNRIESIFQTNMTLTEDNLDKHDQLINDRDSPEEDPNERTLVNDDEEVKEIESEEAEEDKNVQQQSKINETINVFEDESNETNNWYASASDPEDDDIRRGNPNFLECMNQILLQNIQDNINSPPKTPTLERKSQKRVKFSDEEDLKENLVQPPPSPYKDANTCQQLNAVNISHKMADYYETPIQKTNFYETPQSIYSNDYEQILSKSSEKSLILKSPQDESHYYVDMDTSSLNGTNSVKSLVDDGIIRKSKIMRTPPALPPKPANLLSKYKIQSPTKLSAPSIDSEPDYCSISELNLPQMGQVAPTAKKLNVVAEINVTHVPHDPDSVILHSPKILTPPVQSHYDLDKDDLIVASKAVEKVTIQMAKTSPTKSKPPKFEKIEKVEVTPTPQKHEPEIPKLPQVSEILIPEEDVNPLQSPKKDERMISHDNYIKINSQIFKHKISPKVDSRRPILIGSSVSSLITTFNNQQLLAEMSPTKSPPRGKLNKKLFSSFENLQNLERHEMHAQDKSPEMVPSFEFDLSQNFEEFKLDECDMDEYDELNHEEENMKHSLESNHSDHNSSPSSMDFPKLNTQTIEILNQCIENENERKSEKENNENENHGINRRKMGEPTYEHFLECTGLSSKSILTPARMLSNHKSILKPRDRKSVV